MNWVLMTKRFGWPSQPTMVHRIDWPLCSYVFVLALQLIILVSSLLIFFNNIIELVDL